MTEQQKQELSDKLFDLFRIARLRLISKELMAVFVEEIESILSPLPHQDGASAEEILSAANGYPFLTILPISNWDDAIKAMHQFSKSETAKVVAELEQLRRDKINIYEQINSHQREVIESGGLRFSGVHMIHISEAFQSHGVDTGLPF